MVTRSFALLAGALLCAACPDAGGGTAPPPKEASASPATPPAPTSPPATPAADLGAVLDGAPLPFAEILGAAPPVAESYLGPSQGKGGIRKSCVRFVPERTFFSCGYAWQRYADKTGTFGIIEVLYEDGHAASIIFEGVPDGGEFSPDEALRRVGLRLPGPPTEADPAEGVKRWSWFNSAARLLIGGRQYRVEVSNIGGEWAKTRVDVILNDPLTEAQRAKILAPAGAEDDAATSGH
jgi:hypothetical protein